MNKDKIDLDKIFLKKGSHKNFEDGACIMEMVSYLANEPWSDRPQCVCPRLTSFAISYNDKVDDRRRQELKILIPKLINSRDPSKEKARIDLFVHHLISVVLPLLTEALGLEEITLKLRAFKSGDWKNAEKYILKNIPDIRVTAAAAYAAYQSLASALLDRIELEVLSAESLAGAAQ